MVKPIPDGYHAVTPYVCVDGGDAAIGFYKKAFGAEERFRLAGPDGKIMHAEISIGGSVIMLSDSMPEHGAVSPKTLGGSPVGISTLAPPPSGRSRTSSTATAAAPSSTPSATSGPSQPT